MQDQPKPKQFLTVDDVADELGLKRRQVYHLATHHGLPARKFGGLWRVGRDDLQSWVDSRSQRQPLKDGA